MIGHMSVLELRKLLLTVPPDLHIGPSVGNFSLCVWDAQDEELLGMIHASPDGYEVEFFGEGEKEEPEP